MLDGLALVALKRTGCDVWQMECRARNVTANVQSDHLLHGYMLPVFSATDQLHRPPSYAEIQPVSQQDASATRPYRGLVLDTREKKMKTMKNSCILHKQNSKTLYLVVTVCFQR